MYSRVELVPLEFQVFSWLTVVPERPFKWSVVLFQTVSSFSLVFVSGHVFDTRAERVYPNTNVPTSVVFLVMEVDQWEVIR